MGGADRGTVEECGSRIARFPFWECGTPLAHIFENVWQIKDFKSCVFGSVGKGLSDFWCRETALERSQRIPFELPISYTRKCIMEVNEMSSGIYGEFLFFP